VEKEREKRRPKRAGERKFPFKYGIWKKGGLPYTRRMTSHIYGEKKGRQYSEKDVLG